VLLDRLGPAALLDLRGALAELGHEGLHAGAVLGEAVRGAVGAGVEDHRAEAYAAGAPAGRLPDAYEALTNRVQKDRRLAHVPAPIGERRSPPLRRAVPIVGTLLSGLGGNDTISGAGAADVIYGNGGNDTLNGDAGPDKVYGGPDDDTVAGGDGLDRVVIRPGDTAVNCEVVTTLTPPPGGGTS